MKKFYALFCFILTLLVCSTPLSAQDAATVIGKITPVTSLDQLKEGAQLVFYNAGRQTYIYEDTENGNLMLSADFQVMQMGNSRFMFTLSNVAANGNNVSAKIKTPKNLYVPQLESGKIVASSNAGDSFTFTLSASGKNRWNIQGTNGLYFNGNGNTSGDNSNGMVGWSATGGNSDYLIYEVETATIDTYVQYAQLTFYDSDNNIIDDYGTEMTLTNGDSASVPSFDFFKFDYERTMPQELFSPSGRFLGDINNEILYICYRQDSLPFNTVKIENNAFSDDTKWYTIKMREKYLCTNPGEESSTVSLVSEKPAKPYEDKYLWCFVGDARNGFKVYNRATGTTYALQNDAPTNAGNINLKQGEGSSYLLSYQNNAYLFRAASDEVTNAYWNDFSAQGVLKFWVSDNATSDAGSKITFEAYNPHLTWVNIDVRRVDEQMNPIDTITVEAALGEELELPAAPENYTLESKEFEHYVVENTDPITVVYAKYRTTIIKMLEEGTDKLLQTDTLLTPKGTELTMPIPTDGLYVLVTKGYEEYVAEKDSVITLYFKFGLPFEPATIVDGQFPADQTKWYHIKLRGKYIAANADDPTQPCITVTGEPADNDLYLWTVTGDTINGFYLYCRAYGAAMGLGSALSSDVENSVGNIVFYPYLTETPSAYRLSRNGTGYSLMLEGSENVYINEFGGVDNVVAYWVSENAAKDNGSRLEFEEVGIVPEGIDNVTLTPADNAVYDLSGRRVSNPSKGIYIINGKKVYLK